MLEQGKHYWQQKTDYGRGARVENTMYSYKTIIGNKLKSRSIENQKIESKIAVNIINTMTNLGMACSKKLPSFYKNGSLRQNFDSCNKPILIQLFMLAIKRKNMNQQ